jgi:hypothetical protein
VAGVSPTHRVSGLSKESDMSYEIVFSRYEWMARRHFERLLDEGLGINEAAEETIEVFRLGKRAEFRDRDNKFIAYMKGTVV